MVNINFGIISFGNIDNPSDTNKRTKLDKKMMMLIRILDGRLMIPQTIKICGIINQKIKVNKKVSPSVIE